MKRIIIICFLSMLSAYRIIPNTIPKDKVQHLNKEMLTMIWKEAMEAKQVYQQIHNTREELIENLASSAPREEFVVNVVPITVPIPLSPVIIKSFFILNFFSNIDQVIRFLQKFFVRIFHSMMMVHMLLLILHHFLVHPL